MEGVLTINLTGMLPKYTFKICSFFISEHYDCHYTLMCFCNFCQHVSKFFEFPAIPTGKNSLSLAAGLQSGFCQ